jgi:hypothetical protein
VPISLQAQLPVQGMSKEHVDGHIPRTSGRPYLHRVRLRIVAAVTFVVTLPITVGALRAVLTGWAPTGDEGAIQTWTWDSGTGNTPLVGMPSTVAAGGGVHHPGPLQFWMLALPARAFRAVGDSPAALVLAQALVNSALLALGLAAVAMASVRRKELMASATVAAITLWGVGATIVYSPYNPEFAFVALVAAALAGFATLRSPTSAFAPVALVITASAAGQPHLSYSFPAAAILGVGAVAVARSRPNLRRTAMLVTVLVLCWLGPIIDVLAHRGGNLRGYLAVAGTDSGERTGVVRATHRLVRTLSPWDLGVQRRALRAYEGIPAPSTASWIFAVVVVAVAAAAWWHRPLRLYVAGVFTVALLTGVGLTMAPYGFAVLFGPHMIRLFLVPAVMIWALAAASLIAHTRSKMPTVKASWIPALRSAAVACPVALSALPVLVASSETFVANPSCADAVRVLSAATEEETFNLDARAVTLQALWFETFVTMGYYSELVARGDQGRLVGSPPVGYFAPARLAPDPAAPSQLVLTVGSDAPSGPASLLASVSGHGCADPASADQLVELRLWRLD